MKQVIIDYQNRGWRVSSNSHNHAIFKEPNGTGFFVLTGAGDGEKALMNSRSYFY